MLGWSYWLEMRHEGNSQGDQELVRSCESTWSQMHPCSVKESAFGCEVSLGPRISCPTEQRAGDILGLPEVQLLLLLRKAGGSWLVLAAYVGDQTIMISVGEHGAEKKKFRSLSSL